MAIKNKNGTEYKLRGPNPIMMQQDVWEDFQLHNMQFQEEIQENKANKGKSNQKITLGQTITLSNDTKQNQVVKLSTPEPTPQPTTAYVSPSPTPFLEQENVLRPIKINEKLANYPKDVLHCLPAKSKIITDTLYEEKTIKISYEQNFLFEAIIMEETDFELNFWTHLQNVTKYSIIYPKNKNKRWWKVEIIKNAPEGFFVNCRPSDIHPSF